MIDNTVTHRIDSFFELIISCNRKNSSHVILINGAKCSVFTTNKGFSHIFNHRTTAVSRLLFKKNIYEDEFFYPYLARLLRFLIEKTTDLWKRSHKTTKYKNNKHDINKTLSDNNKTKPINWI
jgi:hypothetical protein